MKSSVISVSRCIGNVAVEKSGEEPESGAVWSEQTKMATAVAISFLQGLQGPNDRH